MVVGFALFCVVVIVVVIVLIVVVVVLGCLVAVLCCCMRETSCCWWTARSLIYVLLVNEAWYAGLRLPCSTVRADDAAPRHVNSQEVND